MSVGNTCYICHTQSPMMNQHHVIMQAAGGESGPVVTLCPNCHQKIHAQALNMLAKTPKKKQYFTPDEMTRAGLLIKYIVIALQAIKEGKTKTTKTKVVIEMDASFLKLLHILKADAGHSNLGIFCANILRDYARRRV